MIARKTYELLINKENVCIQECEKPHLMYPETGEDDEMNSVWNNVIDDQQDETFWCIYLIPILSKCFRRCFPPS